MASPPPIGVAVFPVTPLQQNCTLVWCRATNKAALIDPGGSVDGLLAAVAKQKDNPFQQEAIDTLSIILNPEIGENQALIDAEVQRYLRELREQEAEANATTPPAPAAPAAPAVPPGS